MPLKNKKGVSVIIGYVLLIVFAMLISVGVYSWMKTYVPREPLNCPDGVSLYIKAAGFNSSTSQLNITTRNNGRFDIAGYFIHATNTSNQTLPSIDLSPYLKEDSQGIIFGSSVLFSTAGDNALSPGDERTNSFNIPAATGNISTIRVIPTRFQEEDNRQRFVSCGDSRSLQLVGPPGSACVPSCSGKVCGSNGCGGLCGACSGGNVCNSTGQCILPSACTDTCSTLGYQCNNQTICGVLTDCGTCNAGFSCDTAGQCTALGNGFCDFGETCSNEPACNNQQASCPSGQTCQSGACQDLPLVANCPAYCVSLGYNNGACTNSAGNCNSGGGVYESVGDQWCSQTDPQADTCCCRP